MDLGNFFIQLWNNCCGNYNSTITTKFLPQILQKIVVDSGIVTLLSYDRTSDVAHGLCNDMQQDALCFIVWMWELVWCVNTYSEDTKYSMHWDRSVKTCSDDTKHPTWCVIMQNIVQKINRSSFSYQVSVSRLIFSSFLLSHQSIDTFHFKHSYDCVHNIFFENAYANSSTVTHLFCNRIEDTEDGLCKGGQ